MEKNQTLLKKGNKLKAIWPDGLELTGSFVKKDRGYVILKDEKDKVIVCNADVNFILLEVK